MTEPFVVVREAPAVPMPYPKYLPLELPPTSKVNPTGPITGIVIEAVVLWPPSTSVVFFPGLGTTIPVVAVRPAVERTAIKADPNELVTPLAAAFRSPIVLLVPLTPCMLGRFPMTLPSRVRVTPALWPSGLGLYTEARIVSALRDDVRVL
jgi:hypothetical protein